MSSGKNIPDGGTLNKMKVTELRDLIRKNKISVTGSGKGGGVLKSDLVTALLDHRSKGSGKTTIAVKSPSKTPTPKKKAASKKKASPKKGGVPKCNEPQVLNVKTRKCIGMRKFPKEYVFNVKYRVVGPEDEVKRIIEEEYNGTYDVKDLSTSTGPAKKGRKPKAAKKTTPKSKTPTPKKKETPEKTPSPKKSKTPTKKRAAPKKTGDYLCGTKDKKKCKSVCDVATGKCLALTKAGEFGPAAKKFLKEAYPNGYFYNKEFGLLGEESQVKKNLEHWGLSRGDILGELPKLPTPKKATPKKTTPKKATPKKGKKAAAKKGKKATTKKVATPKKAKRCDDKEDYVVCDDNEVCDATSGKCVLGAEGDTMLVVDDRKFIGDEARLLELQGILGGEIKKAPTKKVATPKKKAPAKAKKGGKKKKAATPKKKETPEKTPSPKKKPSPKKPKTPTPKKKETPEKTPSPKKKSPVKAKAKPTTIPIKKKAKRCDDKEDYLRCDDSQVCDTATGKCTEPRKGAELVTTDGRRLVGDIAVLEKLRDILGGSIKHPSPVKPKAKTPVKAKTPKKVKTPVKAKTPAKAKSPAKKVTSADKGRKTVAEERAKSELQKEIIAQFTRCLQSQK